MIDQKMKEKFLMKLSGRAPSSEDVLQPDKIDSTETLVVNEAPFLNEEYKLKRQKEQIENSRNDALVGAAPALLGLLTGNYNRTAMGFNQGNAYLKQTADQDKVESKDLVKIMRDGRPTYVKAKEALDEEVPVTLNKRQETTSAGSYQFATAYSPSEDKYFSIRMNTRGGGISDTMGRPMQLPGDAIIRPAQPKSFSMEDVRGGKTQYERNIYKNSTTPIKKEKGSGDIYGTKTEGQAKVIEKGLEDAKKEYQDLTGSLVDAQQSLESIQSSKDPRVVAQSIYSLIRSVEAKGVLTDQDFKTISGDDYRSFYQNLNKMISTKAFGNIDELRNSYIGLAKRINQKINEKISTIPARYSTGTQASNEALKNTVPVESVNKKNKAKYLQLKNAAERRYGKDGLNKPELLQKFLEQKRSELGIK